MAQEEGKFCANETVISFWNRKSVEPPKVVRFYPRKISVLSARTSAFQPFEPKILANWRASLVCSGFGFVLCLLPVSFIFHHSCAGTHRGKGIFAPCTLKVTSAVSRRLWKRILDSVCKTQNRSFYHCKIVVTCRYSCK